MTCNHDINYEFYSTRCVFSIPEPRRGDRTKTMSRIKFIYHRKSRERKLYLDLLLNLDLSVNIKIVGRITHSL